jgi:methylthioribose-1-phosphate isomerase
MLDTVRWINEQGQVLDSPAEGAGLFPGRLRIIDQTRLPQELTYLELDDPDEIIAAIKRLSVRGAPAIGCAAALGLAACAQHFDQEDFVEKVADLAQRLAKSRPTAVNLSWALERCVSHLRRCGNPSREILLLEALAILAEDIQMCRSIGRHGAPLVPEGGGILTHCNAGALAAGDYGTALAPLYAAHKLGRAFTVYSDETRPLLQGSRLTAWELQRAGIDVVTLCDSMAAQVMREKKVDLVIVGSDRIAANGDAANKIGTYGLAVLASHHGLPFYVAAPSSTIDASLAHGGQIPIEQRHPDEVRKAGALQAAPEGVRIYNPAFDVTPHELITGILTENGLMRPPFDFH